MYEHCQYVQSQINPLLPLVLQVDSEHMYALAMNQLAILNPWALNPLAIAKVAMDLYSSDSTDDTKGDNWFIQL